MTDHDATHGSSRILRPALAASQFMAWASAVIVMSIVSYFLAHFTHTQHLIYQEVIAVLYVAFYLPGLFLPFVKSYKGYMAPLGWIFSYLWLTAFIFAAQDYNWHNCARNSPPSMNHCGLKKTSESFTFLSFFFTLTNIIIEYVLWDKQRFKTAADNRYRKPDYSRASADTGTTVGGPAAV